MVYSNLPEATAYNHCCPRNSSGVFELARGRDRSNLGRTRRPHAHSVSLKMVFLDKHGVRKRGRGGVGFTLCLSSIKTVIRTGTRDHVFVAGAFIVPFACCTRLPGAG